MQNAEEQGQERMQYERLDKVVIQLVCSIYIKVSENYIN